MNELINWMRAETNTGSDEHRRKSCGICSGPSCRQCAHWSFYRATLFGMDSMTLVRQLRRRRRRSHGEYGGATLIDRPCCIHDALVGLFPRRSLPPPASSSCADRARPPRRQHADSALNRSVPNVPSSQL